MIAGIGSGYGPELTMIGAVRTREYLRESIVKPDAVVANRYLLVEVMTPEGQGVRGIRVNEDSFTIQIKDQAQRVYSLRKSQLSSISHLDGESAMPSYEKALKPAELDDLVAYLASLR